MMIIFGLFPNICLRVSSSLSNFKNVSFLRTTAAVNDFHLLPTKVKKAEELNKCASAEEKSDEEPIALDQNPYQLINVECILCKYKVPLDYKNTRLLSQFVSSFSGRLYEKHITGLCDFQQERVRQTILLSRKSGHMPIMIKNPKFLKDPRLFDPMRKIRPNPY